MKRKKVVKLTPTVKKVIKKYVLTFSEALEHIKQNKKLCRKGWNGKNMYIFLVKERQTKTTTIGACISMYTAQGITQPGWLASQSDMLASDWCIKD